MVVEVLKSVSVDVAAQVVNEVTELLYLCALVCDGTPLVEDDVGDVDGECQYGEGAEGCGEVATCRASLFFG